MNKEMDFSFSLNWKTSCQPAGAEPVESPSWNEKFINFNYDYIESNGFIYWENL